MSKLNTIYRITLFPDYDYEIGDAEDAAEAQAILERDGAWGYAVEVSDAEDEYGDRVWEDVDSCFGFLGNDSDYMMAEALSSVPKGTTVSVYEQWDTGVCNRINTMIGTRE